VKKTLKIKDMKKWFIQKKWFRDYFPASYFVKVNGVWSKHTEDEFQKLNFEKGQKIEDVTGPGMHFWIYCQNSKCKSVLNIGNSFLGELQLSDRDVWSYKCSCCEMEQYYIPEGPMAIGCDKEGVPLSSVSFA
jgi:hypothetical protein